MFKLSKYCFSNEFVTTRITFAGTTIVSFLGQIEKTDDISTASEKIRTPVVSSYRSIPTMNTSERLSF